ncbi:hypothetical protein BH24ACI4_BH24ACI4_04340 [soil metagenome]
MTPTLKRRSIEGISAVLLPYTADGAIDESAYQALVARTYEAGLVPAIASSSGTAWRCAIACVRTPVQPDAIPPGLVTALHRPSSRTTFPRIDSRGA